MAVSKVTIVYSTPYIQRLMKTSTCVRLHT